MKRILFVDDEPRLLDGLRRMLRPLRGEWAMQFAPGGPAAAEVLARDTFDVVVLDRMPEMDGTQVLALARERSPQTARIVLTGHCEAAAILRLSRIAHQHLSKPCDPDQLKATVRRTCALRQLLADEPLLGVVSRLETLPSLPALYQDIIRELESPEPSIQKVGAIIARDVGMTAKILQMIHSALFGFNGHVTSPTQAVLLLGLETVQGLVLAANIFSQFDAAAVDRGAIHSLWHRSQRAGALSRAIARAEGADQKTVEYAAMAGLLHETGRVVLLGSLPETSRQIRELNRSEGLPLCAAERRVLGTTHAEIGAYLLGLWGLPDAIVEAVAWHQRPSDCPARGFCTLAAVHAAGALLARETGNGEGTEIALDMAYLDRLRLTDRIPAWQDLLQATGPECTC